MTTPTIPAPIPQLGPGIDLSFFTGAPASGIAALCGTLFMVGLAEQGPVNVPVPITTPQDYAAMFGANTGGSALLANCAEGFLGETQGAGKLFVIRAAGPTPVLGQRVLPNSTPATTLTAKALYPGAYSANLGVEIIPTSGTFTLNVYLNGVQVRSYVGLATGTAAVAAINGVDPYISVVDAGLGTNPVATGGVLALSAGTDDRTDIADANYQAALDSILASFGPGQVAIPARATTPAYTMLAAHAVAKNGERVALYDVVDQPTSSQVATASSATATLAGTQTPGDAGTVVGFWGTLNPLPGTTQTRTVPGSVVVAARAAVTDAKYGHAAEAAAGVDGRCTYFTGISGGGFDAPTRLALNGSPGTAGAITAKSEPNVSPIEVYGWRTASANAQWYDLAPRRYMMSLAHRVRLKTLAFTFKPITKVTIADLGNSAKGELVKDLAAGALDPDNPAGPYSIDTTGNTPTTKQQRRLMLRVGAAPIRTGEHVHTDLVFNV